MNKLKMIFLYACILFLKHTKINMQFKKLIEYETYYIIPTHLFQQICNFHCLPMQCLTELNITNGKSPNRFIPIKVI